MFAKEFGKLKENRLNDVIARPRHISNMYIIQGAAEKPPTF